MRKLLFSIFVLMIVDSAFCQAGNAACQQHYNWVTWGNFQGSSAVGNVSVNGVPIVVSMTANYSFSSTPDIWGYTSFNGFPGAAIPNTTVPKTTWNSIGKTGITTMKFSQTVNNPVLLISSLGNVNTTVTLRFSKPYSVVYNGGGMTYASDTTITGTEGYAVIVFPGQFDSVSIYSTTYESYTNITWGLNVPLFSVTKNIDSGFCGKAIVSVQGGHSYQWSGGQNPQSNVNTFTASGLYQLTVTDINGCKLLTSVDVNVRNFKDSNVYSSICKGSVFMGHDSTGVFLDTFSTPQCTIRKLHLTVNPSYTLDAKDSTVCASSFPFTWHGKNITDTGINRFTLFTSRGCDSIIALHVLKNTAYINQQKDTTVCSNYLPFSWHGQNITDTGIYHFNYHTTVGCDSIIALHFLKSQAYINQQKDTTVCSNYIPFKWHGQNIADTGIYHFNYHTTSGCDSIIALHVLKNTAYTNQQKDTTVCSNYLPFSWHGQNISDTGIYHHNYHTTAGCDSIIALHVLKSAAYINQQKDTTICSNYLPFSWHGQNISDTGIYHHNYHATAGCDSIIALHVLKSAAYINQEKDTTVCSNYLPFSWHGQNIADTGIYHFNYHTTSGCDSIIALHVLKSAAYINQEKDTTVCSNYLPFIWHGQNIADTGIYHFNYHTTAGCDSIIALHVLKNTAYTNQQKDTTVCSNYLPFSWHGQNIPDTGIYHFNYHTTSGCDSIIALHVLKNTAYINQQKDTTVCSNYLPFSWHGLNIPDTGIYHHNYHTTAGCDSIIALHVLKSLAYTNEQKDTTICSNYLPFSWHGQNIADTGIYHFNYHTTSGCDSIIALHVLKTLAYINQQKDTTICSNYLPFSWHGQNIADTGIYHFNYHTTSGCDSIIALHVLKSLAYTNEQKDTTVCSNYIPFNWHGQNIADTGIYHFNYRTTVGCDSIIALHVLKSQAYTNQQKDTTICSNHLPFSWHGQNIADTGIYHHNYHTTSGCDSIIALHVLKSTAYTNQQKDTTICSGNFPFTWHGQIVTGNGTFIYNYHSVYGCDSIVKMGVYKSFGYAFQIDTAICSNNFPFNWNGLKITGAGTYPVMRQSMYGCDSSLQLRVSVMNPVSSVTTVDVCKDQLPYYWNGKNYMDSGSYRERLITSHGCDSTAVLMLKVKEKPRVTLPADTVFCPGSYIMLTATLINNTNARFSWNVDNTIVTNAILVNSPQLYKVTATNSCGSAIAVCSVHQDPCDILIPNVFSPNGDGINDLWKIPGLTKYPKCDVKIFDRYGREIFSNTGYNKPWDGTWKGSPVSVGTYYYIIDLLADRKKIKSGWLLVLR